MFKMGNSIEFDDLKCVKCTKCVTKCKNCSVGFLEIMVDENGKKHLKAVDNKKCIYCGQCTLGCPINAIRNQSSLEDFKEIFKDKSKVFIVQSAPSVRTAIGEGWKLEHNLNFEKKMNTAFRKLGFNYIFDVTFGADITTMIEAEELIERLENKNSKLPMFTSCCPSWVEYVLNYHPELIDNLTTARSPHIHSGIAYKTWWAERNNIDPKTIIVVSIMPCTSTKEEALKETSKINDLKAVDFSLNLRETIQLIKENNIDFPNLEESESDKLGKYSGAGIIYGSSGGVMESALRTAYKKITGENLKNFNLTEIRCDEKGFKIAEIKIKDKIIKVAVVSTIQNVEKILEELKKNPNAYHYVEVMNCMGGCLNGGGMPKIPNKESDLINLLNERRKMLYILDENKKNERIAHGNPYVIEYIEWAKSKNDLKYYNDLFHTKFN